MTKASSDILSYENLMCSAICQNSAGHGENKARRHLSDVVILRCSPYEQRPVFAKRAYLNKVYWTTERAMSRTTI